jgi:hypothetical protein
VVEDGKLQHLRTSCKLPRLELRVIEKELIAEHLNNPHLRDLFHHPRLWSDTDPNIARYRVLFNLASNNHPLSSMHLPAVNDQERVLPTALPLK